AAGLVVQRAAEVAEDRAGLADGLALLGDVALVQARLGAADALGGAGEQERHQLVRIGFHNRALELVLAVLLGVAAMHHRLLSPRAQLLLVWAASAASCWER